MDYEKHPVMEMVKMCNCAGCDKELLGLNQEGLVGTMTKRQQFSLPDRLSARIAGRPYCEACVRDLRSWAPPVRVNPAVADPDPGWDNVMRAMEEDR